MPDDYVVEVARVIQRADWHTYQVLTKRAERMAAMLAGPLAFIARKPHIQAQRDEPGNARALAVKDRPGASSRTRLSS